MREICNIIVPSNERGGYKHYKYVSFIDLLFRVRILLHLMAPGTTAPTAPRNNVLGAL